MMIFNFLFLFFFTVSTFGFFFVYDPLFQNHIRISLENEFKFSTLSDTV